MGSRRLHNVSKNSVDFGGGQRTREDSAAASKVRRISRLTKSARARKIVKTLLSLCNSR